MRTDLHHLKSLNLWSFVTAEMEVRVAESNSCDPMDCGLPGSSVLGLPMQEYPSGLPFPSRKLVIMPSKEEAE